MIIAREVCQICGMLTEFKAEDEVVLLREATCVHCGASLRNSDVAGEVIAYIRGENTGLKNQKEKLDKYRILNTCSSGYIHNALKGCEGYTCCEYFSQVPSGSIYNDVLCVDLCNIPFDENTFDIVISEDVLEHICDFEKAMSEILRVLKVGGKHIFTVPLHEGRKTIGRQDKEKVYHGDPIHEEGCLVVTDWGDDIGIILESFGYSVDIQKKHVFYTEKEITDVDKSYDEYLRKKKSMDKYFKYNSVVIAAQKGTEDSIESLFTGERFVPGIRDVQLEIEHYQRYESVQELVRHKTVLDAACGEGYGSNILASTAEKVIGLDISDEAVERAKIKYGDTANLSFVIGSIAELPLEDNSVDIIVSFETIEHVAEELQVGFLREIGRVLKKDGILVMSTPNKEIYSDLYNFKNEFHIKEFYKDEFIRFLGTKFENIKLYNQYFEVASFIDSVEDKDDKVKYFKNTEKYLREGKYFIALASNGDLSNSCISSVFMNEDTEYDKKIARIFQLQEAEEVRNKHLRQLDDEINAKNEYILQLQKEQEQCNALEIEYKKMQKESELIWEKKQEEWENKLLKANKADEEKSNLEHEVVLRGEHILKLDKEIAELREYRALAERELNSRSYKMALKLRNLSFKILPKNSNRRFLFGVLLKTLRHPRTMYRTFKSLKFNILCENLKANGMEGVRLYFRNIEERESSSIFPCKDTAIQVESIEEKKRLSDYEKLQFPKNDNPEVSIVIPVYNEFEYTYGCLKSILNNSGNVSYEIIIADDNSTDFTSQIEEVVSNIRKITSQDNLRFLLNCNKAAKVARGKYIVFLNNDTQVQDNWLKPLLGIMKTDCKVGLVGPKLIYQNGWLQEAGGIVWKDASAWNFGNRTNPEQADYNYLKEVDFISGACIMIRKELWEKIGGFDEQFAPAYYEDVDLAFEVRKHDFKVIYQPLSSVVHFEGISNGTSLSAGQKAYQLVNKEKFYRKWEKVLEKENYPNGESVFLAKDRSRFKKHILVVDHYVPHFDKDAGGRGTFMYLKLFVEMGMHVTFIGDNFYKHEPYTTILNQEGIEILYGEYYLNNCEHWLKENGKYFDYVYLQRPHISVKYIDLVKKYTNAKVIYYDVDLCHVRELRQYEITKEEALLESAARWKEIEFGLIEKADVIHVVGSYEEQYLKEIFPEKPIRNIPLYIYSDIKRDVDKDFANRKNILFVGGFGHPPNEDAVLWFARDIFPRILKKYPDIIWYIVGAKPPKTVQDLASVNIIIKGFVSDEELQKLYKECRIDVVPLRYGAGVKGKVLEAIYNQIPLVTTSIGAEGLSTNEEAFWVEDDAEKIASLIIDVYEDFEALKIKSDNSNLFIENHFLDKHAKEILKLDMS
ncbi:methyltransferase domain-containing protein [Kineothrix sedimenti]|uniref:Methyltransferase domain-containing protein n=1 Tax=Kineothrix sedimenti TaxID=3123317 RepID=A0ABZ3ETD9_9FIRM